MAKERWSTVAGGISIVGGELKDLLVNLLE
jgi:hypothetical protein